LVEIGAYRVPLLKGSPHSSSPIHTSSHMHIVLYASKSPNKEWYVGRCRSKVHKMHTSPALEQAHRQRTSKLIKFKAARVLATAQAVIDLKRTRAHTGTHTTPMKHAFEHLYASSSRPCMHALMHRAVGHACTHSCTRAEQLHCIVCRRTHQRTRAPTAEQMQ